MATRPWGILDLFAPVPNSQMELLVPSTTPSPRPDTQKRPRSEVQITRTLADGRPVFTFESKFILSLVFSPPVYARCTTE